MELKATVRIGDQKTMCIAGPSEYRRYMRPRRLTRWQRLARWFKWNFL